MNKTKDSLICNNADLTNIDISNNPDLKLLYCYNNNLEKLDLSNNLLLEVINCQRNNLKYLDVSKNLHLDVLLCTENPSLKSILLQEGQKVKIFKDQHTAIIYKNNSTN